MHKITGKPGKSRKAIDFTNEKRFLQPCFPNENGIENVNYFFKMTLFYPAFFHYSLFCPNEKTVFYHGLLLVFGSGGTGQTCLYTI